MDSSGEDKKRAHGVEAGRSFFSPKKKAERVFVPYKQCIEASGDCFTVGRCLQACKKNYPDKVEKC